MAASFLDSVPTIGSSFAPTPASSQPAESAGSSTASFLDSVPTIGSFNTPDAPTAQSSDPSGINTAAAALQKAAAARQVPGLSDEDQAKADQEYVDADTAYRQQYNVLQRAGNDISSTASGLTNPSTWSSAFSNLGSSVKNAADELSFIKPIDGESLTQQLYMNPVRAAVGLGTGFAGFGHDVLNIGGNAVNEGVSAVSPALAAQNDLVLAQNNQDFQNAQNTIQSAVNGNNSGVYSAGQVAGAGLVPVGEGLSVLDPITNAITQGIQRTGEITAAHAPQIYAAGKTVAKVAAPIIASAKLGPMGGLATLAGEKILGTVKDVVVPAVQNLAEKVGPGWLDAVSDLPEMSQAAPWIGKPAVQNTIETFPDKISAMQDALDASKGGSGLTPEIIQSAQSAGLQDSTLRGLASGDKDAQAIASQKIQDTQGILDSAKKIYDGNLDGSVSTAAIKTFVNAGTAGLINSTLAAASSPENGTTDYSPEFATGAALSLPISALGGVKAFAGSSLADQAAQRNYQPFDYGVNPDLDAAHNAAMQTMSPADQQAVNNTRGFLQNADKGQLYVLPPDQFKAQTGSNGLGATDAATKTIYLNSDNIDQGMHEVGHTILNQANPVDQANARKAADQLMENPQIKQAAIDSYTARRQADNPDQSIQPPSDAQIRDEILVDSIKKGITGNNINQLGLPKQNSARAIDSIKNIFEPSKTPIGLPTNTAVRNSIESLLRHEAPDAFLKQKLPSAPPAPPDGATPFDFNTPPANTAPITPPTQNVPRGTPADINNIKNRLYQHEAQILAANRAAGAKDYRGNLVNTPVETTPLVDAINAIQGVHEAKGKNPNLTSDQAAQVIQNRFKQATPLGQKFYDTLTPDERNLFHNYIASDPAKAFDHFATNPNPAAEDLKQAQEDKEYAEANLTKYQKSLRQASGLPPLPEAQETNANAPSLSEIPEESAIKAPTNYAPTDNRVRPFPAVPDTDVEGNPVLTTSGLQTKARLDKIEDSIKNNDRGGLFYDSKAQTKPKVVLDTNGNPIRDPNGNLTLLTKDGKPVGAPSTFKGKGERFKGQYLDFSGSDPLHDQILGKGLYDQAEARAAERSASRPNLPPVSAQDIENGMLKNGDEFNKAIASSSPVTFIYDSAGDTQPSGTGEAKGFERQEAQRIRSTQDSTFSRDAVKTQIPLTWIVDKDGTIHPHGYSTDKLLANANNLFETAGKAGIKLPYSSPDDPELLRDMRTRAALHNLGYKTDGTPIAKADAQGEEGNIASPPNPLAEREAKRLVDTYFRNPDGSINESKLDFLSLVDGHPQYEGAKGQRALLKSSVEKQQFAQANNPRVNLLRNALETYQSQSGGKPLTGSGGILEPTLETLNLNRVVKMVEPTDQNIPAPVRAEALRQRGIGREIIGKELPNRDLSTINYSPKTKGRRARPLEGINLPKYTPVTAPLANISYPNQDEE